MPARRLHPSLAIAFVLSIGLAAGPADRFLEARNPGLGLRALHARGWDGRGVHIAYIDHPLRRSHQEFRHALARVETLGPASKAPSYHGTVVASIAVGRRGTAHLFGKTRDWRGGQ